MKNLSFLFVLFLSVSFMSTNLNAQSCKSAATLNCSVKSTDGEASTTSTSATAVANTTKASCTAAKTSCGSSTSMVNTFIKNMTDFKTVSQVNMTTDENGKAVNCNPANCDPANCDPAACKPAACNVSDKAVRKTSTSI